MIKVYDFIGIGLGPFNLSLAALTSNIRDLDGLFFDQKEAFNWHPGLMLESVHLQTPFMADLVILADPTHPLSFLNYAKQQGRLYQFYIREDFFLMRKEYNQYCRWVISQLDNCHFGRCVTDIQHDSEQAIYAVKVEHQHKTEIYYCKKLILGTGPTPHIPLSTQGMDTTTCFHALEYLDYKPKIQSKKSITLVGSGQSAAEIYYDLLQDVDQYQLNWVTRSPRFFPLEYSKLTLEMTSPDYIDYFHELPSTKRDELNTSQKGLYKGINTDLINAIYDDLYIKSLDKKLTTDLITNTSIQSINSSEQGFSLTLRQEEQQQDFHLNTEAVIFATGFSYQPPRFLSGINHLILRDEQGRFQVNREYFIDQDATIFVQNAELHTHGFTAPDLGMACYRNSIIINQLLGFTFYPVEKQIAFQTFDARKFSA
ncbi:MAG: SidA/IucD/PvdA family monooxygenase [Cellvibrionales bacterium]|nr:SidA/IucD/PvdA family monooxygenase [Cellvibrionales bacterium]